MLLIFRSKAMTHKDFTPEANSILEQAVARVISHENNFSPMDYDPTELINNIVKFIFDGYEDEEIISLIANVLANID